MIKFSKIWLNINLIFLGFYLYLIPQVWVLLIEEKEKLKKNVTVYKGLSYISIYEIFLIFIIFGKIVYIIFMWYDKVKEYEIKLKLKNIEFFCFIPQLINFFLLLAQISYYHGNRFKHKEEFIEIKSFKIYAKTKEVLFYLYSLWFFILIFYETCSYCRCCGIYPHKKNDSKFLYRSNRISAV